MSRHFAVRSQNEFTEEFGSTLRSNCERWQKQIDAFLEQNQHHDFVSNSTYIIGPVRDNDTPHEFVIELSGTPTYGLLKLLEDQFPLQLLLDVATENLANLELGYFNSDMGVSTWRQITDDERSAILDGRVTGIAV